MTGYVCTSTTSTSLADGNGDTSHLSQIGKLTFNHKDLLPERYGIRVNLSHDAWTA
jgi:hypothetical protein